MLTMIQTINTLNITSYLMIKQLKTRESLRLCTMIIRQDTEFATYVQVTAVAWSTGLPPLNQRQRGGVTVFRKCVSSTREYNTSYTLLLNSVSCLNNSCNLFVCLNTEQNRFWFARCWVRVSLHFTDDGMYKSSSKELVEASIGSVS